MNSPELRLAIALAVGLLVGVERERRKSDRPGIAGVRSFALIGLLGGVLAFVGGEVAVWVGAAFVGVLVTVGYVAFRTEDPGMTTEVALFLTYALGALAMRFPMHALGLGVVVTMVLALRTHMHAAARKLITDQELLDGLTLAVCALVVLPLVPNEAIDPWGVVNPFVIWRLVVLVTAITAAGYVAQRAIGPRFGLPLAGFASGFVSSAATVGAMGQRARSEPGTEHAAVAGAAASTVATFIQIAILVGAASPRVLLRLAIALALAGAVAVGYALYQARVAATKASPDAVTGRAFSLRAAIAFAAVVTIVSLLAEALRSHVGVSGLLAGAGLAGFADAHAISASLAALAANGNIPTDVAAVGVMIATSTNTLTKAAVARSTGPSSYFRRVTVGVALALAAGWAGFAASAAL